MTIPRLDAVLADVRALGWAAPLRAAYEGSKRTNAHTLLFRTGRPPSGERAASVTLGAEPADVGAAAAARCLTDAAAILDEGLRVFGTRAGTGLKTSWATDPLTGRAWPDDRPWWQIDIRSGERLSDVKYVWEVARHRDLVVLARASRLEPDGRWLPALTDLLRTWCHQNPPEQGVHWYSSLELALRAISWSQVLDLVGDRLPGELVRQMEASLLASARHLIVELPYTVSSMRNNHLLGDALGLITLARLFPGTRRSARWARIGEVLFGRQLARHMRPDGSMIEDSISYHRFVLEMLVVRVLLGDAPEQVRTALAGASRHLRELGALEGPLPQIGDWDEGRVLASSGDPLDLAGSTALGLALSGEAVPPELLDLDEPAWYLPTTGLARPAAPSTGVSQPESPPRGVPSGDGARVSGGIAYVRRGPWSVWFKAGAGPSHGHADLGSVWIRHGDAWVVADPGTGTYNGPLAVRNGLRDSAAHPVLRPDGVDQLEPHRAFRWQHSAHGRLAPVLTVEGATVLFGWHDAYDRLEVPLRIARAIVITDSAVTVLDHPEPSCAPRSWALTVPLHPDVQLHDDQLTVAGRQLIVHGLGSGEVCRQVRGQEEPFAGWHSDTYGQWRPATWLQTGWSSPGPFRWGVHTGGTTPAPELTIEWSEREPVLLVDAADGSSEVQAR